MKRSKFLFLFIVLTIHTITGQNIALYSEIQNMKNSNQEFANISSLFIEAVKETTILNYFADSDEVYFFDYLPDNMKRLSKTISLNLSIRNKKIVLELMEVPSSFYNYKIKTSSGKEYLANADFKHYRGIVKDNPNSLVTISFFENEVKGLIATNQGNFNLVHDKHSNKHILYNDKNLIDKREFECATNTDLYPIQNPGIVFDDTLRSISPESKYVKLYFETEYDIYQQRGSVSAVERYVTSLYNQVATLYQNEGILTILSEIKIWNTEDPFTTNNQYDLLDQFSSSRNSFNGDVAVLLTFRSDNNNSRGGLAFVDGLCRNLCYAIGMLYNEDAQSVPNFSRPVYLVTHEIGHVLGSYHTHDCKWNGNDTAIDGCERKNIRCPDPGMPSQGGTIMSYCHLEGRPGVNFNLGFGPQPGNLIRNKVNNASCLERIEIKGPNNILCSGATFSFPLPTSWTVTNGLQILNGQSSNSISVRPILGSSGSGRITVTYNSQTITKDVSVGTLVPVANLVGSDITSVGISTYFYVLSPSNETNYEWTVSGPGNAEINQNHDKSYITFNTPGNYSVGCRAISQCTNLKQNNFAEMNVIVMPSGYSSVSPNPVSDILYIDLNRDKKITGEDKSFSNETIEYNIRMYDIFGTLHKTLKTKEKQVVLNVSGLPNGNYLLHIYESDNVEPQIHKVIIKH